MLSEAGKKQRIHPAATMYQNTDSIVQPANLPANDFVHPSIWDFRENFWAARRRPYIVFTFTGSVRNVRNDV